MIVGTPFSSDHTDRVQTCADGTPCDGVQCADKVHNEYAVWKNVRTYLGQTPGHTYPSNPVKLTNGERLALIIGSLGAILVILMVLAR